ncbi:unnamed protein product [Dovyalis caffra]|uniref:BSD2 cysteine rich domain-containing protein n=1 Tax=Dovyalis caffra TaxID=77055 RepID=A0AAV1RMB8_9ROSI|nr:unnamed protein product [Dovyalis caffra]
MATILCSTSVCSSVSLKTPGQKPLDPNSSWKRGQFAKVKHGGNIDIVGYFYGIIATAAVDSSNKSTKPNSIVCANCDGNGAVLCSQCKGAGVNSVDHFNGQFKAGGLCWLCRGKREILCGNCNGAGFVGGFMSTFDD